METKRNPTAIGMEIRKGAWVGRKRVTEWSRQAQGELLDSGSISHLEPGLHLQDPAPGLDALKNFVRTMNPIGPPDETPPLGGGHFATTRWNVVLAAADSTAGESQSALEQLCRSYWPPLYAFLRRNGCSAEEARDLTQGFFEFLLEHHTLHFADPHRGRFRNFLLAACKRYLQSEHRLASAQKRGIGITWLPWSDDMKVPPPADPPEHLRSAEACYEHQWALTLLGKVMRDLRAECGRRADPQLFDALKDHLCMADDATPYAALADQLGISAVTLRVTVHRLRERYRQLLRSEIAHTVSTPAEIEDEIRHLIEVVGW